MASGLFAEWMHVVVIMFLAATIYAQMVLLRLPPSLDCLALIQRASRFNLTAVLLTVTTGAARLYRSNRGLDWFLHNGYFQASLAVFALTVIWTIFATTRVRQWRATFDAGALPDRDQWAQTGKLANAQPLPLLIVALLMTLMARAA